jgi:hypothetical protein
MMVNKHPSPSYGDWVGLGGYRTVEPFIIKENMVTLHVHLQSLTRRLRGILSHPRAKNTRICLG